jgi:hypothetical protein
MVQYLNKLLARVIHATSLSTDTFATMSQEPMRGAIVKMEGACPPWDKLLSPPPPPPPQPLVAQQEEANKKTQDEDSGDDIISSLSLSSSSSSSVASLIAQIEGLTARVTQLEQNERKRSVVKEAQRSENTTDNALRFTLPGQVVN